MRPIKKGSTDQSVVIRIIDSTDGTPENAVVWNTEGIDLWYRREGAVKVSITEATLATLDAAHSDGGFLFIGDGYYRLDLPDAAVVTGADGVMVGGTVTGMIVIGCYVPLVDLDPYTALASQTVGTCTTNTDMRGTDGANTVVPDAAGTAAALHGITDGKVDGVQADVTTIAGDVVNIDGDSMRGTDGANSVVPDAAGTAAALHSITDGKVDGVQADVTAIAGDVVNIDGDSMRGTDGANTVVPDAAGTAAALHGITDGKVDTLHNLSAADVNTEVDTALSDIHLDHLLASSYDPASKPGAADALLNEIVENDGGISRFTQNALEQSPSGGTNPNVLINTTIAGIISQTEFSLTAGSNDDDAYKDQAIVLYDASDSDYPSIRKATAYVGSTKTLTIDSAPDFTITGGDGVNVFVTAPGTTAPTTAEIVAAWLAATGVTEGGTWTLAKLLKVKAALAAGNIKDKSGVANTYEILDPDDGSTVVAEVLATDTSPYWQFTIKI